jgi:hypothetical protein
LEISSLISYRTGGNQSDFVDHRDDGEVLSSARYRFASVCASMALGRVDHQKRAFTGRPGPG